jgi:hypothetical protein
VWQRVTLEMFYGRHPLVSQIISDTAAAKSTALVGGRKFGKTTLLRFVEKRVRELYSSESSGIFLVPVYIDCHELPRPLSARKIYETIVNAVEFELQCSGILDRSLYPSAVGEFARRPYEPNRVFREIAASWVKLSQSRCLLTIAILLDEIEVIGDEEWSDGFFANWRSLLSNSPELSGHLAVVFTGVKEISALAQEIGSPLANILTVRELELFSWRDSTKLIMEPTRGLVGEQFARRVYLETGGHPFLIQYLLQAVCNHHIEEANVRLGEALDTFLATHSSLFSQLWFKKLDANDREVYSALADSRFKLSKKDIIAIVGDSAANKTLSVLCHSGIAKRNGRREQYRAQGELFRTWCKTEASVSSGRSECDKNIYEKLMALNKALAIKYAAAWSIHNSSLPNYSGAISEMRDTVTLTLHALAPDTQVTQMSGFEFQSDGKKGKLTKPTRSQRVAYIEGQKKVLDRKKLLNEIELFEALTEALKGFVRDAYEHASARTHLTADREAAWKCLKQMDSVLAQLL